MVVDFYQIKNCQYEYFMGRHVIFAPEGTSEDLLYTYRFFRADDGRACHFLTPDEYYYVMDNMNTGRAVFGSAEPIMRRSDEEQMLMPGMQGGNIPQKETDNTLCFISLALLIASFCVTGFASQFSVPCFIASYVLAIVARSKNPKSTFALVLIIVHSVLVALAVLTIISLMIACGEMTRSCNDCHIPG
ncbi:MAG: hypothetical protein K6G33_09895 [Ruminococcus sp.]|uniref:hypothetical protein n=1 Tax=Ruminococcus sp. TaxID=41978 RepID=UPI0025EF6D61|nr:hypothetical protein [Ruminococcus sp.]MCR5601035.1 hypothetical protein [Ruminococcus sp.]